MMLQCPNCEGQDFLTENTRPRSDGIHRTRTCKNCGTGFVTVEITIRQYHELIGDLILYETSLSGLADALHKATT